MAARGVLFVAGEPSGDRIAASVARVLAARGVAAFGMGGAASAKAGVRLVADLSGSAAMGLTEVAARLPRVVAAFARLRRAAREERPRAAVLVNYTEFNARLGRALRALGIPVLWCVAPQVWAWRPDRARALLPSFDRMAVILPFEEDLWRQEGADARYVGHPALDLALPDRSRVRTALGLHRETTAIALMPGSRAHEVRRLAPLFVAAWERVKARGAAIEARLLASPWLDRRTRSWLEALAKRSRMIAVDIDPAHGAGEWLPAFDAAWSASGTATLESALAGAPPVIAYRVSRLTGAVARRMLRISRIGLPNILLGASRYPELVQGDANPAALAHAMADVLARRHDLADMSRELRLRLQGPLGIGRSTDERIAAMTYDWLA